MATTSPQVACPPSPNTRDTTAPRKRRRRAPATGAADDCFACLDRKSKCDRRRPYCTQCLDVGKDCSGYKTTLTWGVGVASRGKLRGLTLPIVGKSTPAANPQAHRARSSVGGAAGARSPTQAFQPSFERQAQPRKSASSPTTIPTNYDFVSIGPATSSSVPCITSPYQTWPVPGFQNQVGGLPKPKTGLRRRSLRPLNVPLASCYHDFGVSKSAPFFGAYHFPGYMSPVEYPHTPDDFTFTAGPLPFYKDFPSGQINESESVPFGDHISDPWPCGSLSSSLSSDLSSNDFSIGSLCQTDCMDVSTPIAATVDDERSGEGTPQQMIKVEEDLEHTPTTTTKPAPSDLSPTLFPLSDACSRIALTLSRSLPSLSIGKTPRLQYLINYYDTAIAPFIVAFDGPTNPYRTHILKLAVESETLQHALAALSASNLRTREYNNAMVAHRRSPVLISYTSNDPIVSRATADGSNDPFESRESGVNSKSPSAEELHHKRASVQSLNADLADPLRRKDDCILATLLILCLYHVCDTGVAKFRTQFEGVQKILSMRSNGNSSGSNETSWLTTMFTWFDAMTATVNDREGQIQGAHLDMAAVSGDEWALENLAGCDRQLFKIIAKLGRLNLLSQGRQVERRDLARSQPMTCSRAATISRQDYYSMNHDRFDGNGWVSLLNDEDLTENADDSQAQFWKEWSQIRTELQDWELESPNIASTNATSHIDRGDLLHISESFRHSALIYTERLAQPQLPSLHPNFQNLVAQAIYHMTSVKSDVFLLWPLFITGTECVDEHHRSIIRQRCLHIQRDSGFFNNISVLELLEKIWRDDEHGQQEGIKTEINANGSEKSVIGGGQKFRWRKAMERPDGEYIVI
ncbi:hypothetical protein MMC16_005392 [Acarospora aff. strigata]|nr:hypothetical protein [Acarospora aff. strigata]